MMDNSFMYFRVKAHRRVSALLAVWSLLATTLPFSAFALPKGGTVRGGNVSWETVGNTMTVNQRSNSAIINWNSFSIGRQETVKFAQPGSGASVLNRVTGPYSSEIFGSLLANGNVYLINQNGILFGAGARVNVGGLVASTFNLSDEDFNAGRLHFTKAENAGKVINQGNISAASFAYLVGSSVENSGTITAPAVALAAGHDKIVIDRTASGGEIRLSVDAEMPAIEFAAFDNPADLPSVVNEGHVDASGAVGGQVVMQGVNVVQAGTVSADGTTAGGGTIRLLGDRLVALGSDSTTTANAGLNGDGGRIEIIAENFAGIYEGARIAARGGSESGDGGFVETSGHQSFVIDAAPDVGAANGKGGEWLIDPRDITIDGSSETGYGWKGGGTDLLEAIAENAIIPVKAILSALANSTHVTIQTTPSEGDDTGFQQGNITVAADINLNNSHAGATLTLDAANNINLNANITAADDNTLGLTAGGNVVQALGKYVTIGTVDFDVTGNVDMQGANKIGSLTGTVGNNLKLVNSTSLDLDGLRVANGTTTLTVAGDLTDTTANIIADLTAATTGDILLDADNDFGEVTANANNGAGAITLVDVNNIVLRDIDGGSLNVDAGDNITQKDGTRVMIAGKSDLTADGAVILFNEGNDFGGAVDASATEIQLRDKNTIELGVVDAGADGLTVQTDGGAITQTDGGVEVEGETRLLARDGAAPADILLGTENNDFTGAVHADGANIALADINDIKLGLVDAKGTLDVTAVSGAITQTDDGVTAQDKTTLTAFTDITLTDVKNDFINGPVDAIADNNIALVDKNGITLGHVNAGGTLDVTALAGDITQNDAGVTAVGIATLTADGNDIILTSENNDFQNAVNAAANNSALVDKNGIKLGLVNAQGTLDVTALADGAITQTGDGVTAAGIATLIAEGNAITLGNENNDFQNTVNAYGADVTLVDGADGIRIGVIKALAAAADTTAADTVSIIARNGGIADAQADTVGHDAEGFATQAGGRTVNIMAANLTLDADGDIGAGNNPLDISADTLTARSAEGSVLVYESDALTLAGISAANHAKVETINGTLTVGGTVETTAGDILLAANGAGANVILNADVDSGNHLTVLAADGIKLGAAVSAQGSLNLEAKAGSITTSGGVISADVLQIVTEGDIGGAGGTESDVNNQALQISVSKFAAQAGGSIYVKNTGGDFEIATAEDIGDIMRVALDCTATPLSQTGNAVSGVTAADNVKIVSEGGDFTVSAAVIATDGDLLLRAETGSLKLNGALTAGDLVTGIAKQDIVQSADIVAGGDVYLKAQEGVLVSGQGGAVNIQSGGSVLYTSAGDLTLSGVTANGTIGAVAGGNILGSGDDSAVDVKADRIRLEAGESVGTAANALNIEAASVEVSAGGEAHLRSQETIKIGGVGEVTTDYARFDSGTTTEVQRDLSGFTAGGNASLVSIGGDITQTYDSDRVYVGGDTRLEALTGTVDLENTLNDFVGKVDSVARNNSIYDRNDLLVGHIQSTDGGHVRLTAGGSIIGNRSWPNVTAGTAELYAGRDIGAPLYLDVDVIQEARAGGNIKMVEVSDNMSILGQVYAGGHVDLEVWDGGIVDVDGDGYVPPRRVTHSNADIYAGRTMRLTADFVGSLHEPVELISRGPLHLDSHLEDANGKGSYIWVVINGSVGRGPQDIKVGEHGASVPGLVIYNGQAATGPWVSARGKFQLAQGSGFERDQANLLDAGIVHLPWFLHPDMSLLSQTVIRDDLRVAAEKTITGAVSEIPEEEPRTDVIGIPVTMVK